LVKLKMGIDNLLRAYVSSPATLIRSVLISTPIGPMLTSNETDGRFALHYEEHLSECSACRKNVVALCDWPRPRPRRLGPAREVPRFTLLSGAKQMFGALSQPQWAMVAAAVIVAAISVPLLLIRSESRQHPSRSPSHLPMNRLEAPASLPVLWLIPPQKTPLLPLSETRLPGSVRKATRRLSSSTDRAHGLEAHGRSGGVGGVADVSKNSKSRMRFSRLTSNANRRQGSSGLAQGGAAPTSRSRERFGPGPTAATREGLNPATRRVQSCAR